MTQQNGLAKQDVATESEIVRVQKRGLAQLHKDPQMADAVGEFLELINKRPPESWIKKHPTATVKKNGVDVPAAYLPVGTVEFILRSVYQRWEWQVIDFKVIANAVAVHGRLRVQDPVTLEWMEMDGVGAKKIIIKKGGGGPTDFNSILPDAIEMVLPAAESMALKCAAQKLGKLFGGDLNRNEDLDSFESKYRNKIADWVNSEAKEESK